MYKIVIIDDERYAVEYLCHVLDWKKLGFEVFSTTNPLEIPVLLKNQEIDLLLTDIRMPEYTGMDLLNMVSESELKTKVIFLSGYSDFQYAQQGIKRGLFAYLLKPIVKEELAETIQRFLNCQKSEAVLPTTEKKITDTLIEQINEYINEHLNESLSLEEIARKAYLSPGYLSQFYKKETGCNLSAYILEQRIKKSKELLLDSALLISDVAKLVGFNSSQYFIRVFKENTEMTPQQYRSQRFAG